MTIKQHLFNGCNVAKETRDLYFEMQNLNRAAIKYAADIIKIGMNLSDIKTLCENYLLEHGADSFWYWDVGAFVFAGDETAVSVSGKDYQMLKCLPLNRTLVFLIPNMDLKEKISIILITES